MSEQIKVGDLVVIVRTAAAKCCNGGLGAFFRVTAVREPFRMSPGGWSCSWCGKSGVTNHPALNSMVAEGFESTGRGIPLYRLKKIPPASELEGARDVLSEREPTKAKV